MVMEALGGAVSVIAVVDLAAKAAVPCSQYVTAVSKPREEISRLREHLKSPPGLVCVTIPLLFSALLQTNQKTVSDHTRDAPSVVL